MLLGHTVPSLPVLHLWYHPFRIPPSDTCMPVGPPATDEKKTFLLLHSIIKVMIMKKRKYNIKERNLHLKDLQIEESE